MASLNYMKKLIVLGFISIVVFYSIVAVFWRTTSLDSLERPMYRLISPFYMSGNLNAVASPDTGVVMHVPVLDLTKYVFLPTSFAVDTAYIHSLVSHSAYFAKIFAVVYEKVLSSNSTGDEQFSCRCGRVSDPCVCCGQLSAPRLGIEFPRTDILKPIVMPSLPTKTEGNTAQFSENSPSLCVNITYRPKTGKIHLTATLLISDKPSPPKGETNIAGAEVKPDAVPPTVARVALFDTMLSSPLSSPPTTCAENSLPSAPVAVCVNLTRLSYIYDPGTEHKTAFLGCGRVQIIVQRQYIVADYGQFCFRAHRGAVDDADQAAAVKNDPANKLPAAAAVAGQEPAGFGQDSNIAAAQEAAVLVPPDSNAKSPALPSDNVTNDKAAVVGNADAVKKHIAGSFDHNDINRGVP